MKKNRREIGTHYEKLVAEVLIRHGYEILAYNFRGRRGEIDLVALDGDTLVFIEVKYRKDLSCGRPEEAVDRRKQQVICRTADEFRMKHLQYAGLQIRFDVAAITGNRLRMYPHAFEYQGRNRWI